MIKKIAVVAAAVIPLAACGHHSSLAGNPVVQKDVKAEQARIDKCLAHGTLLTKSGRKQFFTCASGGMTPAAFETCATKQLGATSLLTKHGRENWLAKVASTCVVKAS